MNTSNWLTRDLIKSIEQGILREFRNTLLSAEEILDLLQGAWLRLLLRAQDGGFEFQGEKALFRYLSQNVRFQVSDRWARSPMDPLVDPPSFARSPEEELSRREERESLQRQSARLTRREKRMAWDRAHRVEVQRTARALDLHRTAVRSATLKAFGKLRRVAAAC